MTRSARAFRRLRVGAGAALMLAAAGCGTGPNPDLIGRLGESVLRDTGLAEAPPAPPRPTREQLASVGRPILWTSVPAAPAGAPMLALTALNGKFTYLAGGRQSVTIEGAQLTATHGFAHDLAGYRSDPALDPVVRPRPLAQWPDRVERVYRHRDAMAREFVRGAVCRPVVAGPDAVTVFGRVHPTVRVDEACSTPAHAFVNRYWVEPGDGAVWKSEQWIGPEAGSMTIEAVIPPR